MGGSPADPGIRRPFVVCLASLLLAGALAALEVRQAPPASPSDSRGWTTWRGLGADRGLPQQTVFALAADGEGFVWAGTQSGLARYDGRRFVSFPLPDHPFDVSVRALAADGSGRMWVGTDEAGLWRIESGLPLAVPPPPPAKRWGGVGVLASAGNVMWVGTSAGLARCDAARCTTIAGTESLQVTAVLPDLERPQSAVLAGTRNGGVVELSTEPAGLAVPVRRLGTADGLPEDTVLSLARWGGAAGTDLWVGTARGLARLSGATLIVYGASTGFPAAGVHALVPAHASGGGTSLMAATYGSGLVEIRDDGTWTLLDTRQGLPENHLYCLMSFGEPPRRRLWIGTSASGVARQEPARWRAFAEGDGLPHRNVVGVGELRLPDGVHTWVGTVGGMVELAGDRWIPFGPPELSRRAVYRALSDGRGVTWLATDAGLARWQGARWSTVPGPGAGPERAGVMALHRRRDGALWAGSYSGLMRLEGERLVSVSLAQALSHPAPTVLAIAESGGRLWVGTPAGLAVEAGGGWATVPPGCLPDRRVLDVRDAGEGEGAAWVATRAGVVRIEGKPAGGFRCTAPPADLLPPRTAFQLEIDDQHRLYVFGLDGVTRIRVDPDRPEDARRWRVERFDRDDGLPALEFNRVAFRDGLGRVWAGSVGGVAVLDPESEPPAGRPAPLRLLRAESASGRALAPNVELAWADGSVSFEVALLAFEREHRTRYRTELTGLEGSRTGWTPDPVASYMRLPPGRYRFRAVGRDGSGVESAPVEVAFSVAYPAWTQPWAMAGYAALLLAAGLAAGRIRARSLVRRAALLEGEVAARTRELAEANLELERRSLVDQLTGLRNRHFFDLTMPAEIGRALRRAEHGEPRADILLLLLDLDHFKSVNDRWGHATGDAVLREIASRLRGLCRESDWAVRWGGEELLMVLLDSDRAAAASVARGVLQAIGDREVDAGGQPLAVTVSIGFAAFPFDRAHPRQRSLDEVLALADRALYRAKESGRDRAVGVEAGAGGEGEGAPAWTEVGR